MARGKLIEQSEIDRIFFLKKEGLGPTAISKEVNRSVSAVHKILALNPRKWTEPESAVQS
jgi:hypothetical protein